MVAHGPAGMSMQTASPKCPVDRHESSKSSAGSRSGWPALAAIFLFALAVRIWFNFSTAHIDTSSCCDAFEYWSGAVALAGLAKGGPKLFCDALSSLIGIASLESVRSVGEHFQSLKGFSQAGPVFPLFIALCFSAAGRQCDLTTTIYPVAGQCVLSALACVLIALVGFHAWNKRVGIAAGVLAAIYPGFIVASGRLYSESFSTFLVCLVTWLAVRGFVPRSSMRPVVFLGIAAACLQLTRSIMIVLSLVLIPIVLGQHWRAKRWKALSLLLLGFAITLVPWLCVQHLALGRTSLVVDRVGHYNFFVGTNVDTSGWLSVPYPDGRGIESKSFARLASESWRRSPDRFPKLMADKIPRLFKFPWNDFRAPVGPFDAWSQILLHQLFFLFAGLGLITGAASLSPAAQGKDADAGRPDLRARLNARLFIFGLFLFHLAYCLFITVPRYNLTAMPLVTLLAAAGLVAMRDMLSTKRTRRAGWLVAFSGLLLFALLHWDSLPFLLALFPGAGSALPAMAFACAIRLVAFALFLGALVGAAGALNGSRLIAGSLAALVFAFLVPALCFPLRAHGRLCEWQCPLDRPGQTIAQEIRIDPLLAPQLERRQLYLLIDADGIQSLERGLAVTVNGARLYGPFVPSISLLDHPGTFKQLLPGQLNLEIEHIFSCLTAPGDTSNSMLRQWFLCPIPIEAARRSVQTGLLKVTVRKTDDSLTRLYGTYPSGASGGALTIPSVDLYSWEKAFYGVENEHDFTDTRYDSKVKVADRASYTQVGRGESDSDLSPAAGRQYGSFFIRALLAPDARAGKEQSVLQHREFSLADHSSFGGGSLSRRIEARQLPPFSKDSLWLVRLSGRVSVLPGEGAVRLSLKAHEVDGQGTVRTYESPWMSRVAAREGDWTSFDVAVPFRPGAFPNGLQDIEVGLVPSPAGSSSGLENRFQNVTIQFSELPCIPTAAGHEIL